MRPVRLLLSPPDRCGYLPAREASSLFVDPHQPLDARRYAVLLRLGFRRSGRFVYRPHCARCNACVPVRVPVAGFSPDRSQRRNLRRNDDLRVRALAQCFSEEHYALYLDYQRRRHPGGSMGEVDRDSYLGFLAADWGVTEFAEFRAAGELLAVAVFDRVAGALSAVYTFYSAAGERRGLGTYAVLWLIGEARRLGLEHVYLGYWIEACRKMRYKVRFAPCELLRDDAWQNAPALIAGADPVVTATPRR